jgi:hypothetical protein
VTFCGISLLLLLLLLLLHVLRMLFRFDMQPQMEVAFLFLGLKYEKTLLSGQPTSKSEEY